MIKDEDASWRSHRCHPNEYPQMADVPDLGAPPPKPSSNGLPALYDVSHVYVQQQPPLPQQQQQPPVHRHSLPPPPPPAAAIAAPSLPPPPNQQTQSQTRTVKRPRPVKSCTECRKRKLRCDRNMPCASCDKSHRLCKYAADQDSTNLSDASDGESERPRKRSCGPPSNPELTIRKVETTPVPVPTADFPSATLPVTAQAFEEMAHRVDHLERMLNIHLSKSTCGTETSSSVRAARLAPPVSRHQLMIKPRKDNIPGRPKALRTRYLGANCTRVLLSLFPVAQDFMHQQNKDDEIKELFLTLKGLHKVFSDDHHAQMVPVRVFVDSMTPIHQRMADILPKKKSVCDRLLETYFTSSETLYRIVHIPSFRQDYNAYWNNERRPDSFLPLLLSMMALATKFESRSWKAPQERLEGINIPTACTLVRMWLDGLRGKDLVDMTTLQAEVLLSHAQRMVLKPQESWSRLGLIVRMAMSMGLHRDPSEFNGQIPQFEGELRRRLWWTILDMDLHMSLQCNLPCAIRHDDFTCKPPRNLNDEDIYPDIEVLPEGRPLDEFTATQLQVHAARTLPHRLRVVNLINRIETVDEHEVFDAGTKLERMLDDMDFHFPRPPTVNDQIGITRWRTRVVLEMHCRRPLLSLYRPFALSPPTMEPPPPQISRAYLRSSLKLLNYLEELDPNCPSYEEIQHQYHLLLRQDILQAAFSVCFYIKQEALRQQHPHLHRNSVSGYSDSSPLATHSSIPGGVPNGMVHGQWGSSWSAVTTESSSTMEDGFYLGDSASNIGFFNSESVCSLKRMETSVVRTLGILVSRMREIGSDLKDIASLSVVLSTCLRANDSPEQKLVDIKRAIRRIIETCFHIKSMIPEHQPVSFGLPMGPSQPQPMEPLQFSMTEVYPWAGFPLMNMDAWDQEFWHWTLNGINAVPMTGAPQT